MDRNIIEKLPEGNKTDAALLLRVSEGDISSFEQIYYRWNKQVYGFMLNLTRSVSDAEDITQEVFARLWNMRGSIDPQKNVQSLIFTIARRIAVDLYRRNGKMAMISSEMPEKEEFSPEDSPQDIIEAKETNLLLELAIGNMPEKQRRCFSMSYHNNLTSREIASQLGLSYDNVRKHIYNARLQLREIVYPVILFIFLLMQE